MYHITRTKSAKGRFQVINVDSGNNEVINTSEPLNSIQSCHKNIISNMDSIFNESDGPYYVIVQDDTKKKPIAYIFYDDGKKGEAQDVKPVYVPGKNKKKKSKR